LSAFACELLEETLESSLFGHWVVDRDRNMKPPIATPATYVM
jgi:hypothetical protein